MRYEYIVNLTYRNNDVAEGVKCVHVTLPTQINSLVKLQLFAEEFKKDGGFKDCMVSDFILVRKIPLYERIAKTLLEYSAPATLSEKPDI